MSLLDMSLAGGAMIVVIAAVRSLAAGRLPRATFTALWAVAVLRLLVPVSVPSAVSVYNLLAPAETAVAAVAEPVPAPAEPALSRAEKSRTGPAAGEPAPQPAADRNTAGPAAGIPWQHILWSGGAALFGAYFALCWLTGRRRFREAVEVEDAFVRRWQESQPLRRRVSVRLSGRIDAPVSYGLFRPVVLLPAATDWRDTGALAFVLAHEYAHIRRLDGLKKLVLTVAVCLHWFNPAVWVMYLLANRDMELACDERVVRSMAGDARAAYARTLIRMAEVRGTAAPMFSWFSANAMEERIISIMKIKKLTAWAVIMGLILTLGVTAVFATSAPEEEAAEPASDPVPYDWGDGAVLFPMEEEDVGRNFTDVSIQWWEPDDFARWVEEQKPLLDAAVGSRPADGTIAADVVWTEERSQAVLAAYEDIAAALEAGTCQLSKTLAGGGQVVIAVGLPWDLPGGSEKTAMGYDLEALMWCGAPEDWPQQPESIPIQTYSIEMEPGQRWVDFGPSQTQAGLLRTIRAYFQCMARAGVMEDEQANDILEGWWALDQEGELPEEQLIHTDPQTRAKIVEPESRLPG